MFSLFQDLEQHKCNKVAPRVFDCPNCDRIFPHQRHLDVHISNGWCAPKFSKPGFERVTDESEAAKRFKVLTGKEPNFVMLPAKKAKPDVEIKAADATATSTTTTVAKKVTKFSVSDRQLLYKYSASVTQNHEMLKNPETDIPDDLPDTGSIFVGTRARGVNSEIRKEIKENGRGFKVRDTLDATEGEILRAGSNFFLDSKPLPFSRHQSDSEPEPSKKAETDDDDEACPAPVLGFGSPLASAGTEPMMSPIRIKIPDRKSLSKKPQNLSVKVSELSSLFWLPLLVFTAKLPLSDAIVGLFHIVSQSRIVG